MIFSAPDGCLQYHTGLTGRLTTFNFLPTGDNHLPLQEYNICIRQEDGFCCVQYEVCADDNAFSISNAIPMAKQFAANCATQDYIEIEGSGATCQQGNQQQNLLVNMYCQGFLSTVTDAIKNSPICGKQHQGNMSKLSSLWPLFHSYFRLHRSLQGGHPH